MGIPRALRPDIIPEDTGLPYRYTQNAYSRQGTAGRGRYTRAQRARSAYTGYRPVGKLGEVEEQGTIDDSMEAMERFGLRGEPAHEGDPQGGYGAIGAVDPALDPQFATPELESNVLSDIFGTSARLAGTAGVGTGAMAYGLAEGVPGVGTKQAAEYGVSQGAKAAAGTLASPSVIAQTFGRGLVATGNLYNASRAGRTALQSSELAQYSPERRQRMAELATTAEYERGGTLSGLKGLYSAAKESLSPTGFGSKAGVSRSQQQAQSTFDRSRAVQEARLSPEYGGGRFGRTEDAEEAAYKKFQVQRSAATGAQEGVASLGSLSGMPEGMSRSTGGLGVVDPSGTSPEIVEAMQAMGALEGGTGGYTGSSQTEGGYQGPDAGGVNENDYDYDSDFGDWW